MARRHRVLSRIGHDRNGSYWLRFAFVVVALTTFVVLVPAVDILFLFASPRPGNPDSEMPVTIVLPLLLSFLAIGLIATRVSTTTITGSTLQAVA